MNAYGRKWAGGDVGTPANGGGGTWGVEGWAAGQLLPGREVTNGEVIQWAGGGGSMEPLYGFKSWQIWAILNT